MQSLFLTYPKAERVTNSGGELLIVDEQARTSLNRKKTIFEVLKHKNGSPIGVKKEVAFYRHILPTGKPHAFDTLRRITYAYDEEHYLIRQVDMEMGMLGHDIRLQYTYLPDGRRALTKIIGQRIRRQGLMTPGAPVGELEIKDFSEFHPDLSFDVEY